MLPAVTDYDVIVVGAGNAALAAVSARERGSGRVVALEKAPRALRGGNTHYSGGLLRIAFDRAEDLRALVPDAEREVPGFFAEGVLRRHFLDGDGPNRVERELAQH